MDANRPKMVTIPFWGPDAYSLRTAIRNFLRANPIFSARSGRGSAGIRPAPTGSVTERTKTDGYMLPQQSFRSVVGKVADPTIKNTPGVMLYPNNTSPQVRPALLSLGSRPGRNPWGGFNG